MKGQRYAGTDPNTLTRVLRTACKPAHAKNVGRHYLQTDKVCMDCMYGCYMDAAQHRRNPRG